MTRIVAFMAFVVGTCVGIILGSPVGESQLPPIKTDFCFLLHNKELFAGRQFLTTALIAVDIHGESLESPDCPDGVFIFSSTLDHRDAKVAALDAEIANHSFGGEVPITFVGTLYTPSRVESAYNSLRYWLGVKGVPKKGSVVIIRIISSGKALP